MADGFAKQRWCLELKLLALLPLFAANILPGITPAAMCAITPTIENPYENVDWGTADYVHSMSHQHGYGITTLRELWEMGYRHVAWANYYPSGPRDFPLPDEFLREHPDALAAPNAEQHSCKDDGLHFNALGSFYATGHGDFPRKLARAVSPLEYEFRGLNGYDSAAPWRSVYWLKVALVKNKDHAGENAPPPLLTVDGAAEINKDTLEPLAAGDIRDRPLTAAGVFARGTALYLRAASECLRVRIEFDPAAMQVGALGLSQGVHRPWRDAFRAALDGTGVDKHGKRVEGLLYPDGGGITINHPASKSIDGYLEMLDYDPRVLGIEIWNERGKFGFGPLRDGETMLYYRHWNEILATGRRCFGFFVKDHGKPRGRNVLVLPGKAGRSREEREHDALRAYRKGCFFGSLGAIAVGQDAMPCMPYDYSEFRFSRIAVRRDDAGKPLGVEAAVEGADKTKRPHTQIRFITDAGVALVADDQAAYFAFPCDAAGAIACRFVRVEAFAYPAQDNAGAALTAEAVAAMNVYEISRMHDRRGDGPVPGVPIADMIFAQPIMINYQRSTP